MTIGGCNLFMGAYAERVAGRRFAVNSSPQISEDQERKMTNQVTEALKQIKFLRNKQDFVSISEEGKAFLCGDAVKDNMKETSALLDKMYTDNAKLHEKLQQTDPEDPFWGNTGNQWLVFSEQLHSNGFYDPMSDEEVIAMESLLDKMTCGMDGVSSSLYDTGSGLNLYGMDFLTGGEGRTTGFDLFNETSESLTMDLESSTTALKYFGEKHISDEGLREEFNGLVDKYHSHNVEILKGYQSPAEKMQRAIRSIQRGKYPNSAIFNSMSQAGMEDYSERLSANSHLGGVSHTSEEESQYKQDLSVLLERIKQRTDRWDDMWKMLENTLVDYTSKDSSDKGIRQAVSEQVNVTLDRMQGYWSVLMGGKGVL